MKEHQKVVDAVKKWLINPDTNQTGLFKCKKDIGTSDHVSECIASDLAKLIEFHVHVVRSGRFTHGKGL